MLSATIEFAFVYSIESSKLFASFDFIRGIKMIKVNSYIVLIFSVTFLVVFAPPAQVQGINIQELNKKKQKAIKSACDFSFKIEEERNRLLEKDVKENDNNSKLIGDQCNDVKNDLNNFINELSRPTDQKFLVTSIDHFCIEYKEKYFDINFKTILISHLFDFKKQLKWYCNNGPNIRYINSIVDVEVGRLKSVNQAEAAD